MSAFSKLISAIPMQCAQTLSEVTLVHATQVFWGLELFALILMNAVVESTLVIATLSAQTPQVPSLVAASLDMLAMAALASM